MKQLDEEEFVRYKMYGKKQAAWKRYAEFVIGKVSLWELFKYEFRTGLFMAIPGALGIVLRKRFFPKLFRRVGENVVIGRNVTVRHGDKIVLGDNVVLDEGCLIDGRGAGDAEVIIGDNTIIGRYAVIQSKVGSIHIGANCNIGSYSVITSQGGIEIGDWVAIAGNCKISGGRFKLDPDKKNGVPFIRNSSGPIRIGENCLFGGSVQVTDGINIGRFCVIGAGAVVMNNIPDYSVFMPRPGMIMGTTQKVAPDHIEQKP